MSMSRKDYEMIARNIKATVSTYDQYTPRLASGYLALRDFAYALSVDLIKDNPAFDPARFLKACGFDPE